MNQERRNSVASSLRAFFDEQLFQINKLVEDVIHTANSDKQQAEQERRIVEHFVDVTNAKMRAAPDYVQRLRVGVRGLYNHVLQVASEIPPPLDFNQNSFAYDPLVNALFASREEIDRLFDKDSEACRYMQLNSKAEVPVMFALLLASRREVSKLGVGRLGDMLVRDLTRQVLNFSDHKIEAPCASATELTYSTQQYLFERVVLIIRQEMLARRIEEANHRSDHSFQVRVNSLVNPECYLKVLLAYLEAPEKLLGIQKIHYRLDKMGTMLEADVDQRTNEFDVQELRWSNMSRNIVLKIAYQR